MNDEIEIKLSILDAMLIWGMLDEHNLEEHSLSAYKEARFNFSKQVEHEFDEAKLAYCRHQINVQKLTNRMPNRKRHQ